MDKFICKLEVELPIYINVKNGKKIKRYSLTMNNYRNLHQQVLNKMKKAFTDNVSFLINNEKPILSNKVVIDYILYFPDKKRRDVANFGAVVDKFFEDCLVKKQIIEDDCWKVVKIVSFKFGGIDKENPRCEAYVGIWKNEENENDNL